MYSAVRTSCIARLMLAIQAGAPTNEGCSWASKDRSTPYEKAARERGFFASRKQFSDVKDAHRDERREPMHDYRYRNAFCYEWKVAASCA